jgi:hypothetical protein
VVLVVLLAVVALGAAVAVVVVATVVTTTLVVVVVTLPTMTAEKSKSAQGDSFPSQNAASGVAAVRVISTHHGFVSRISAVHPNSPGASEFRKRSSRPNKIHGKRWRPRESELNKAQQPLVTITRTAPLAPLAGPPWITVRWPCQTSGVAC